MESREVIIESNKDDNQPCVAGVEQFCVPSNQNTENSKLSSSNEETVQITNVTNFFESPNFYANAKEYWSKISPTVDGMLGGFGFIDNTDIKGSQEFLNELNKMKPQPGKCRALDCGAGIGRITKNLLVKNFTRVDLVEQDENFANRAKSYLSVNGTLNANVGSIFNVGLQDFSPEAGAYDLIWSQWVLGHLTDDDLREFFKRCSIGLAKNGCIVIKENFTIADDFCIDGDDSSVTRSLPVTKKIIEAAGLRIIKIKKQENFVQGLFPVCILACRPIQKN